MKNAQREPSKTVEQALRERAATPSPLFRADAWRQFQRALDPLGTPRPVPRQP